LAWDDPIVWILIVALVVFLFGSNKVPEFARAIGKARKEFEMGFRGIPPGITQNIIDSPVQDTPSSASAVTTSPEDPLIQAARNEEIDTQGKTRDQIATELAWKLNKKTGQ
jgi:sec-independent protein translocase protein TatA